jgi:hypothetical protein
MLDQGSVATKRRLLLEDRLARVRERIDALRVDPARAPALRAAEIECKHLTRELAALGD